MMVYVNEPECAYGFVATDKEKVKMFGLELKGRGHKETTTALLKSVFASYRPVPTATTLTFRLYCNGIPRLELNLVKDV